MSGDPWEGDITYLLYITTDTSDAGYTPTTINDRSTVGRYIEKYVDHVELGEVSYFTVYNTDGDPGVVYFIDDTGLSFSNELDLTGGVLDDFVYGEDTTIEVFGDATSDDLVEAYKYTISLIGTEITAPESLWEALDISCKNNTTDYGELWIQNPTVVTPECIFVGYDWEYTSEGFPFEVEEYLFDMG